MNQTEERSGHDETVANGLYTGMEGVSTRLPLVFSHFEYSFRRVPSILDEIAASFGASLAEALPPEHQALIDSSAEQSPQDLELVRRMQDVQRDTWAC